MGSKMVRQCAPRAVRWIALAAMAAAGLGCAEDVGSETAPVVYGFDDRLEVYEAPGGVHRSIAETAVAMQTDADWLDRSSPPLITITYDGTLGGTADLCTDVAFQDQPDPGYCSGTLIDSQHLLTAGHCVEADTDCTPQYPWVFGYFYEGAGALRSVVEDDVYECVARTVFQNDATGDFAIIELDRPVVGHEPAAVRLDPSPAAIGTSITMIGHPNGIPMKVAGGASILDFDGQELFTDLDAFYGNSGSGVFDDAGELVGILVSGSPRDYRRRAGGMGCDELVVLASGEDYEYLTPVGVPIAELCAAGVSSPICEELPDGGMPDPVDGGPAATDAGTGPDQGLPAVDAGVADASTTMMVDPSDDGCSCSVDRSPLSGVWALAFLVALLRRRATA